MFQMLWVTRFSLVSGLMADCMKSAREEELEEEREEEDEREQFQTLQEQESQQRSIPSPRLGVQRNSLHVLSYYTGQHSATL